MIFSERAWEDCTPIYHAILEHPFNQELMKGELSRDRFAYYIEQDSLYLDDFARCHALIAGRIGSEYGLNFLKYANLAYVAEQEVVHEFFTKTYGFEKSGRISPATLGYTSYLLRLSSLECVEVGVAGILPCFWVYRDVGLFIAQRADLSTNPYARWIETYSSEDFDTVVEEAIDICNVLASRTTDSVRQGMLQAFYRSTCLEWHFWHDAYTLRTLDDLSTSFPTTKAE